MSGLRGLGDSRCPSNQYVSAIGRWRGRGSRSLLGRMPERRWCVLGGGRWLFARELDDVDGFRAATAEVDGTAARRTVRGRGVPGAVRRSGRSRRRRRRVTVPGLRPRGLPVSVSAPFEAVPGSPAGDGSRERPSGCVSGLRTGAADVVSDRAGGALRGRGGGRWRMNGTRTAGRIEGHVTMVKTQLADDASVSRPPSPRGHRAGGPHAPEGITDDREGGVNRGRGQWARGHRHGRQVPTGGSSCGTRADHRSNRQVKALLSAKSVWFSAR